MTLRSLTISRAAREAGVGVETIRYYQRIGLIDEPPRPREGYRSYDAGHVRRLRFIKRAQELGFTLREIAVLLDLGAQQCAETRRLAQEKLHQVRDKMRHLKALAHTLQDLIDHCEQRREQEACPILHALDKAAGEAGDDSA